MTLLRPENPSAAAEMSSGPDGAAGAIRLDELPEALPRLSPQEGLPKEMLEAAPFRCYSLTGPAGVCGPRCAARIASFSVYFRKSGAEDKRCAVTDCTVLVGGAPHVVSAITMPLATLPIGGDVSDGADVMPRSARKAARKARRLGYRYKPVDPQHHLDDIFVIRSSAKMRQGRPMPDYYFRRLSRILELDGYCERHTSGFYGIFKDETLVAYCTVLFFGEMAQLDNILGHKDYLQDGIMDLLVEEASRSIARERPWVRGLNYLYVTGWTGLADFKANAGFSPQHTSFTTAPTEIARQVEAELSRERARLDKAAPVAARKPAPPLARIPRMFDGARRQPDGWSERSGIHAVLRALALPAESRVLCVGVNGNLAYSALSAVVNKGYRPLVAEGRLPALIAKVESSFGDRCTLLAGEWKEMEFANPFDLAIFDLPYMSFMTILMEEFRAASKLVSVGGFLIVKFYYDIDSGMTPEDRQSLGPLYVRRFKSAQPRLADIADAFRGSAFNVHGLVDRANEQAAAKNLGWLVLRKVRGPGPLAIAAVPGGEAARKRWIDYDAVYGTDTGAKLTLDGLTIPSANRQHGTGYQRTPPKRLYEVVQFLGIDPARFTFVDLGCGKGATLMTASSLGFASVVGVEFAREFVDIARENLAKAGIRDVTVQHGDAADFEFPSGDLIVYLYNPFRLPVLERVINRLRGPRSGKLFIVFTRCHYKEFLDAVDFLVPMGQPPRDSQVEIWQARPAGQQAPLIVAGASGAPAVNMSSDAPARQTPAAEPMERPELMISIDVEAFPRRATGAPVDRLIWGRHPDGESGLLAMMRIAEKHGMPLTTYLDFGESDLHGEALLEIGREIDRRGHDLELHCHAEFIPDSVWQKAGVKRAGLSAVNDRQAEVIADYLLDHHARAGTKPPVSYRGGAYRFNAPMVRALAERGITVLSNYNATKPDIQPLRKGVLRQFYWSNGSLELPISHVPGNALDPTAGDGLVAFNFNTGILAAPERMKSFVEIFHRSHPADVAVLVMHSWSFGKLPSGTSEHYDFFLPDFVQRFDDFLGLIRDDVRVVTARDIAARMAHGMRLSDDTEKLNELLPILPPVAAAAG